MFWYIFVFFFHLSILPLRAGRDAVRRRRAATGAAYAVHSRKRQAFDRRRPVVAEHSGDGSALSTRFLFCQHIIVLCCKLPSLNACCTFSSSGWAPSSVFKVGTVILKLSTWFQFLAHTCYYNMCILGRWRGGLRHWRLRAEASRNPRPKSRTHSGEPSPLLFYRIAFTSFPALDLACDVFFSFVLVYSYSHPSIRRFLPN